MIDLSMLTDAQHYRLKTEPGAKPVVNICDEALGVATSKRGAVIVLSFLTDVEWDMEVDELDDRFAV